jgi:hypothetical protein
MSTAKNVISGGRATEEHHIPLCVQFWPSGTPVADADCSYSGNCGGTQAAYSVQGRG